MFINTRKFSAQFIERTNTKKTSNATPKSSKKIFNPLIFKEDLKIKKKKKQKSNVNKSEIEKRILDFLDNILNLNLIDPNIKKLEYFEKKRKEIGVKKKNCLFF